MENYYVDTIDIVDEHCRHTFIVHGNVVTCYVLYS
eukprot:COSAG01_NODE_2968_length_6788_cov_4.595904_1_plen_35_part_00